MVDPASKSFAVDIGNSSVKFNSRSDASQVQGLSPEFDTQQLEAVVDRPESGCATWFVCSVNRDTKQHFAKTVTAAFPKDSIVELEHGDVPLSTDDLCDRSKLGLDRLVAAFAARESFNEESLIVVDAGTAVTVDVVQGQSFKGGLIFPGPSTSLSSLSALTDALPDLAEKWKDVANTNRQTIQIGTDSEPAILLGVHQHFVCGLVALVNQLRNQHADAKVICTGGVLKACYASMGVDWEFVENLVLSGVSSVAAHRFNGDPSDG